jgi:hypothetical protein
MFQIYGYEIAPKVVGSQVGGGPSMNLPQTHSINIGANLYGVAACLAFLRLIFTFEIHHRIGPILFCIKNVFWDICSVMGSFFITMLAFSVGLVAIFGTFDDEYTQFSSFENAFKRLFWIIFDPGKEEYTEIKPPDSNCSGTPAPQKILGIARPLIPPGDDSAGNFATINPYANRSISQYTGIYIWGFYQVFNSISKASG